MKARSRVLCESSLGCALSAIEVYNKPTFELREQVFSVLMVIAWEGLLKAKVLADHRNRLTAIYVPDGKRRYKRNRSGEHLTISIGEAINRCNLSPVVRENLETLVRVRDAAVHLTRPSPNLPYLVFTLGAATLRNYSRLIRSWFGIGLTDYNFYILPLGFEYPFKSFSAVDLRREVPDVAALVRSMAKAQEEDRVEDGDFSLVCELQTALVSAKKVTDQTDLVVKVDPAAPDAVVISRAVRPIDQYPYTYTDVVQRLRDIDAMVKPQRLNRFIAERGIKADPRYACYNFRTRREEQGGPTKGTQVLYNDAFLNLARTELCQEALPLIAALPLVAPRDSADALSATQDAPAEVTAPSVMPPQPPVAS